MKTNPFGYTNPITDVQRFFGREKELWRIQDACRQTGSVSIVGERRIGKSSLLRLLSTPEVIKTSGLGDGCVFCLIDLQGFEEIDNEQFWDCVLRALLKKIPENFRDELKKALERKQFDNFSLRLLFEKLEALKIIFLFDEFETILQNPRITLSLYGHLRYLSQNCPVMFITATRRELVYHCIDDDAKASPFFNIFENIILKPFDIKESKNLIAAYLEKSEIRFTESEESKLIEITGNYPTFFQMACSFLFYAHLDDLLKDDEAERWSYVEESFRMQLGSHATYFWNKSEEEEKILLAILALLSKKGKADIPEESIKKMYPRYKNDLITLANRSLVLRDNGNYRLFSPLFTDWIISELTDISKKNDKPLKDWLTENEKSLLSKGMGKLEDEFRKVNPKYWDLLRKTMTLVRDPKPVIDVLKTFF